MILSFSIRKIINIQTSKTIIYTELFTIYLQEKLPLLTDCIGYIQVKKITTTVKPIA